jgi:hypothetical protein
MKGMFGFLVINIYVVFGDQAIQQSVSFPMNTYCARLFADLFLNSCETEFIQKCNGIMTKTSHVLQYQPSIQIYR